ncbi:MAG: hypothetical protein IKX37_00955 [Bacteroidales bacterium]|nr:hypothetical protein [Bacteroidales bacterium]
MRRTHIIHLLAAALLAATLMPGCKKNEEDEVLPSLDGYIYTVVYPYLRQMPPEHDESVPGIRILGVTHPEGGEIGYYWKIYPTMEKYDTLDAGSNLISFDRMIEKLGGTLTEPGEYSLVSCAYAKGYYSTSQTLTFYIVDPAINGSLTATGLLIGIDGGDTVTDVRDSKENKYYTMPSGGIQWMRNNLAWTGAGIPLYDCEVMSYPFGRFYTWEEAQTACPEGWRLPSAAEWDAFGDVAGDLMCNARFFDEPMWEYWPQVKITNSKLTSVVPSGYAVKGDYNAFTGFKEYAAFWTADADPEDASMAQYRYINVNHPEIYKASADKATFCASVRCVK